MSHSGFHISFDHEATKKFFIIASLFIGFSANAHPGDPVLAISNDEKNASITILDVPGHEGDAGSLFSAMLTSVEDGDTKRFKSDAISITCESAEHRAFR